MARITARYLVIEEDGTVSYLDDDNKADEMIDGSLNVIVDLLEGRFYVPDEEDKPILEFETEEQEDEPEDEPEED